MNRCSQASLEADTEAVPAPLCRLIPFSVCIYTVAGGLKATFTSSYLHTVRPP